MATKELETEAMADTQADSLQSAFKIRRIGLRCFVSESRLIKVGIIPIPGTRIIFSIEQIS